MGTFTIPVRRRGSQRVERVKVSGVKTRRDAEEYILSRFEDKSYIEIIPLQIGRRRKGAPDRGHKRLSAYISADDVEVLDDRAWLRLVASRILDDLEASERKQA